MQVVSGASTASRSHVAAPSSWSSSLPSSRWLQRARCVDEVGSDVAVCAARRRLAHELWRAPFLVVKASTASSDAWVTHAADYGALIEAGSSTESDVLRRELVDRLLVEWVDASAGSVLDAGCGPVGVHALVEATEAWACDLNVPARVPGHVRFVQADLSALPFADASFDAIVSSLVLMWVDDLAAPAAELRRVAVSGAQMVCVVTHPYFYRSCVADAAGRPVVVADLASDGVEDIWIAGKVGPFPLRRRRPEEVLNAFASAGWRLVRSRDLFISDEVAAMLPAGTVDRFKTVPVYAAYEWRAD